MTTQTPINLDDLDKLYLAVVDLGLLASDLRQKIESLRQRLDPEAGRPVYTEDAEPEPERESRFWCG